MLIEHIRYTHANVRSADSTDSRHSVPSIEVPSYCVVRVGILHMDPVDTDTKDIQGEQK